MLEGPVVIGEAIAAGLELSDVFVATEGDNLEEVMAASSAAGATILEVGDNVLRAVAGTATPQGIVAVARMPRFSLDELGPAVDLSLVLVEVRDPGNAGTLVRTAAAAGAGCVVFARGSVDPFGAKTVRSSAGSVFKVPIARGVEVDDALTALKTKGFAVVGARGDAPGTLHELDLTGPVAMVLGNEAWGFERPAELLVDHWASIPMSPGVESLNVAAAGAVFLFEAVRQRRLSSARHG